MWHDVAMNSLMFSHDSCSHDIDFLLLLGPSVLPPPPHKQTTRPPHKQTTRPPTRARGAIGAHAVLNEDGSLFIKEYLLFGEPLLEHVIIVRLVMFPSTATTTQTYQSYYANPPVVSLWNECADVLSVTLRTAVPCTFSTGGL